MKLILLERIVRISKSLVSNILLGKKGWNFGKLGLFYIFIRFVNLNNPMNFEFIPLKNISDFRMTNKYWQKIVVVNIFVKMLTLRIDCSNYFGA